MSTLKVNKLRDTAGSADAITLDPNGGAVLAGVTTVTSVKVGAAVTISESGIEASGIGITCANINGTQIGGRRNLVINGAMEVAQRDTSSTSAGYHTIDRISHQYGGENEAPTYAQVDVSSGTTPYTLGFRKALKITNGNQTGGAGTSDYVYFWYILEAQDVAKSGWNYTSDSSYITISYWVKSSVAQNFYGMMQSDDGTAQNYVWETGSLTADTWTKIVKTIPGNSNLQFDNNTSAGLYVAPIRAFDGTDRTASMSLETWAAYSSSSRTPDATSTWWTTNDATLEFTGLQLEVGSQATPFEHRSFGEELHLCQRYFFRHSGDSGTYTNAIGFSNGSSSASFVYNFPNTMRALPSLTTVGTFRAQGGPTDSASFTSGLAVNTGSNTNYCRLQLTGSSGMTGGDGYILQFFGGNANLRWDAEL